MNIVPTLEQLAADPAKATSLPRQVLLDLAARALLAHSVAFTALMAAPAPSPEDRLIDVPELAQIMGLHVNTVLQHCDEWPFTVKIGKRLKFSSLGFQAWLADPQRAALPSRRSPIQRRA